jgi:transcriptional regulator with GAF, ATPase, and Fis domain
LVSDLVWALESIHNIALKESFSAFEKEQIVKMIEQAKIIRSAALHLCLDHASLIGKMKCLGIRIK